jgi:transposase InsO family protein
LGIARGSYYRWLKEEAWSRERKEAVAPVQPFEALPEERAAVLGYARRHAGIRHRELAWRMIDEDVAYVSSSTVYRILREADLMCRQRGRQKRHREEIEKASRPDQRWGTDLMYVKVSGVTYFYLGFIDEYSRYIVHWELLSGMDGHSVSLAGQAAREAGDPQRQRELLHLQRVPRRAGALRPDAREDQAALSGGKRDHGAVEPDRAGGIG